jgi:hypothetical protein
MRSLFRPDYVRYEGVRPIHIWLLRLFYFLMAAFVATYSWRVILTHEGPWEPVRAVAFCVWAAYPTLSLLGLLHPLRMLPLFLFAISYKLIWLAIVAYPLWSAGALVGSPAEQMARDFIWIAVTPLVVPWGYVLRTYVFSGPKRTA